MEIKSFKTKLIRKEQLTHDIVKLTFNAPEDFSYEAGQFLTFKIETADQIKPRSYSIFDFDPDKKEIGFIIKIIEGGFAGEMFKKIQLGDEIEMKGPLGHFVFNEETDDESWFIGCGCGLAPLLSMIKDYLPKYPQKKFVLLFSVKKKKDLILDQELRDLENKFTNFTYLPTLTREEWEGRTGRVQKHFPEDFKNKTFYICGIKELVVDTKDVLLSKGVDNKNIKFERYS